MQNSWIDTHHHLWRYDRDEFEWISEKMPKLRRDFLADDIERIARANDVVGCIAVQARQSVTENDFLLEMARETEIIRGVVGWAPLVERDVEAVLERYAANPWFKGVRHVLQGEPDPNYMLRDDFNEGVERLQRHGLRYDVLVYARQLPQTISFVDRHPKQVFVLDHVAKPEIARGEIAVWSKDIRELAKRENVSCKVSGMVTEAEWANWSTETLKPYFNVVLEAFGPRRLMFGSDWPVLTLASEYERWLGVVAGWLAELSADEAAEIRSGTAQRVYEV